MVNTQMSIGPKGDAFLERDTRLARAVNLNEAGVR
jgi:hypothetical protein